MQSHRNIGRIGSGSVSEKVVLKDGDHWYRVYAVTQKYEGWVCEKVVLKEGWMQY